MVWDLGHLGTIPRRPAGCSGTGPIQTAGEKAAEVAEQEVNGQPSR